MFSDNSDPLIKTNTVVHQNRITMEIVLIPHWVSNILDTQRLPLKTIFNFDKMLELFTPDDIVGMILANTIGSQCSKTIFGEILVPTEKQIGFWDNPKAKELLSFYTASDDGSRQRLFGKDNETLAALNTTSYYNRTLSNVKHYKGTEPFKLSYISDDAGSGVIGCVIYPGYFYEGNPELSRLQHDIVRNYVKIIAAFSTYAKAASSGLFGFYLKNLSKM